MATYKKRRDKYNVHQIVLGLTGWAQINGRDEEECKVIFKIRVRNVYWC